MLRGLVIAMISASAGVMLAGMLASGNVEDYESENRELVETLKFVKTMLSTSLELGKIGQAELKELLKIIDKVLNKHNKEE